MPTPRTTTMSGGRATEGDPERNPNGRGRDEGWRIRNRRKGGRDAAAHESADGGEEMQENNGIHDARRRNSDEDPVGGDTLVIHVRTGADPSDKPCVHPRGPRARGSLRKQSPSRATNNGNLVRRLAFSLFYTDKSFT